MKKNASHLAIAIAMLFGLAACGGGGSGSPTGGNPGDPGGPPTPGEPSEPPTPGEPPAPGEPDPATKALSGFLEPTAQGAKVCLDGNRSLACDAGEPATTVTADGSYTLAVPEDTVPSQHIIVAELGEDSEHGAASHADLVPPAPFVLAVPASETSELGVLGTLAALRMQDDPSLGAEQALQLVRGDLGLPADGTGDPADIERLETAALPALRQAASAAYLAGGETDLAAATKAAGSALEEVLKKYIDPATLALWPLIGEKTLVSEAVAGAAPQACEIQPVAVMHIDVEDPTDFIFDPTKPLNGKEPYRNAVISFDAGPAYPGGMTTETRIRGRGNTTWNHVDYLKKPFRLNLPSPGLDLLGMPQARNWALLANHSDKSSLRNALAFCLGKQMNLRFAQPFEFVELHLNGQYQGVYQLVPHTEAHENRVDIGPVWPEEDVFNPDAGYLLEMDARAPAEDEVWFWSAGAGPLGAQRPYAIKSDTVDDPHDPATNAVKEQYKAAIKAEIDAMEAAFQDPDPLQRVAKSAPLVEMEELVDFYLINEFLRNGDAFWSSTYLHRPSNGKIHFGPLWDFDLSSGNDDGVKDATQPAGPLNDNGNWCPQGWFTRWVSSDYVGPLLQDPEFLRLAVARWEYLSSQVPGLMSFIDQASAAMADAQDRNFTIGKGDLGQRVWPNWVIFDTYQEEVDYLKGWLQARADWIDQKIPSLTDATSEPFCSNWITQWNPGWTPGASPTP